MITQKKATNLQAVTQYVYNAGYAAPTPLQVKVLPAILANRNIIIKTGKLEGKTACTFLADIIQPKKKGVTLIITENNESTRKTQAHFLRFVKGEESKFSFFAISDAEEPNKVLNLKEYDKGRIVAVQKTILIDLIRRERFELKHVDRLFIITDGTREEDLKDYQFILSKISWRVQKILFSDNIKKTICLRNFIKKAVKLNERKVINQNRNVYKKFCRADYKFDELKDRIRYYPNFSYVILTSKDHFIKSHFPSSTVFSYSLDNLRQVAKSDKMAYVFCLDLPGRQDILRQLSALINYSKNKRFFFFYSKEEINEINKIEEMSLVTMKEKISNGEKEQLARQAKEISRLIKETTNPELLEAYRKIIKKSMSITTRKYMGAWLMLNGDSKKPGRRQPASRKSETKSNGNTSMLFVSVGKNRRVYPKDLLKLFGTALNLPTDVLGQVKIFPSYSFIEVPKEYCDKAIKELNGSEFRSVKITVNYSKTKK